MASAPSSLRVVSLLASCTDTVLALDLQHLLVGRSHECEGPGLERVAICTSSKLEGGPEMTNAEVDAAAGSSHAALQGLAYNPNAPQELIMEWALGCHRTDLDLLRSLKPDVVLTQVQDMDTVLPLAQAQAALRQVLHLQNVTIVHSDPQNLQDVWVDIQNIAAGMHAPDKGVELVARLQQRLKAAADCGRGRGPSKRLAVIQWTDPLYASGGWVPELIQLAGGADVFCKPGGPSVQFSVEELSSQRPDLLLFAVCGEPLFKVIQEAKQTLQRWSGTISGAQVVAVDAVRLFSRPGPLLVDSLEMLVELLHPEAQSYGLQGRTWCFVDHNS
mmetsp:Transcript_24137/g.33223  ORF Transcript_24137/g.33223 Transcript_24137/m.33223 type:complete len:331 (+) Transcript_24137:117-1109(+)